MVRQMPLQWEARHRSEAPDPLYVTVPPPEFIHKSHVDQVLDNAHQQALNRAVKNIISSPVAEETFAQIVDGLPLRHVALGNRRHQVLRGDPIDNHPELCSGALEKAREFQARFDAGGWEVASAVRDQHGYRFNQQRLTKIRHFGDIRIHLWALELRRCPFCI